MTLKRKVFNWGWLNSFRNSVHYHHGSLEADLVLEEELRALYLDLKVARRRVSFHSGRILSRGASKPILT